MHFVYNAVQGSNCIIVIFKSVFSVQVIDESNATCIQQPIILWHPSILDIFQLENLKKYSHVLKLLDSQF